MAQQTSQDKIWSQWRHNYLFGDTFGDTFVRGYLLHGIISKPITGAFFVSWAFGHSTTRTTRNQQHIIGKSSEAPRTKNNKQYNNYVSHDFSRGVLSFLFSPPARPPG
jgi:hypothetical protein